MSAIEALALAVVTLGHISVVEPAPGAALRDIGALERRSRSAFAAGHVSAGGGACSAAWGTELAGRACHTRRFVVAVVRAEGGAQRAGETGAHHQPILKTLLKTRRRDRLEARRASITSIALECAELCLRLETHGVARIFRASRAQSRSRSVHRHVFLPVAAWRIVPCRAVNTVFPTVIRGGMRPSWGRVPPRIHRRTLGGLACTSNVFTVDALALSC